MEQANRFSIKRLRDCVRLPVLASFGFTAVNFASKILFVIFTPVITSLLTPASYGVYTLYASWVGVFFVVCTLDLTGGGLYRGLQKWGKESAETFLFSATLLFLAVFAFFFVLFLFFRAPIAALTGLSTTLLLFLFAEVFGEGLLSFSSASCRFFYHPLRHAVTTLFLTLFSLFFTILLIRLTPYDSEARPISTGVLTLFVGILATLFLYRGKMPSFDIEVWRFLFRFSLPLFPHALGLCLLMGLGRLTVGRFLGTESLSSFGLAYSIGMAPCFLSVGIQSTYQPWLLRKMAAGKKREIRLMTQTLSFFIGAVSLCVTLIAPEILSFLAPESYRDALTLVSVLSLSVLPLFLFNVTVGIELYYEKTYRITFATLPVLLLSFLLYWRLVPSLGWTVAGVLCPTSFLLLFFTHTVALKKTAGLLPLPLLSVGFIYAFFVMATLLAPSLYGYPVSRFLLVLFFGAFSLYLLYRRRSMLLEPTKT